MRKLIPIAVVTLAVALPTYAARGQDQSYITFDDGGTTIHQGDDGRDVEGRVNLPIYPGDQITTSRRGRSEIRLADGNVIALDRSTTVLFRSILDSYDSDSTQSVIELQSGHVAVQRTDESTEVLRVDTPNASYAAADEAVYAIDADARGRDRVTVFAGSIEVRTPQRSTRLSRGDEARVDDEGLYGLVSGGMGDDFERWFTHRSERYSSAASSRYLDRSLAYSDYDLQENGSWTYSSAFGGWGWRPNVALGWRPYFNGRWGYGPGGCLTWISYEPWGWVPYHYGRWAYDAMNGWLWLPGYTYAPAWVYWAYGPDYIGWAPAGFYDCYRPYYNWAYRPYSRAGFDFGFGFYGRVHLNEVDLRPWTFVSPNGITSHRVDQAALNTDAIRQRLARDPSHSIATVSGLPARFTRSELRDPAAAVGSIARRGLVGGTGREGSGTAADMTPFFRRDPELSNVVRERIVRSRAPEPVGGFTAPSGVPSPGTPGTLEGRSGGRDGGGPRGDNRSGQIIDRGRIYNSDPPQTPAAAAGDRSASRGGKNWRDQADRGAAPAAPATPDRAAQPQNWRGRSVATAPREPAGERAPEVAPNRGADIPRRIIDRIGGARISRPDTPRETREAPKPRETAAPRETPPPRQQSSPPPPPPAPRGERGGGKVEREPRQH